MTEKNYIIRQATPDDYAETENLTREAFWNVYRPGCTEHYILHTFRKREDFMGELDLVMEKGQTIIGHIMFARAEIHGDDGTKTPIMTFGPVSIAPDLQRQGFGKKLLDFSLEKARALGTGAICIEGNPAFYGKSGFVSAAKKGIRYYGAPESADLPYFLVKELIPGFLDGITGTYRPPEGYDIDEEAAEQFDSAFPPKEKLKLPGQLV